jgi:hypothetical protein
MPTGMHKIATRCAIAMTCCFALLFAFLPATPAAALLRCNEVTSCSPGAIISLSPAVTTTSETIEIQRPTGMSVQIDHGNIVGTLALESSNDGTTFYPVLGGSFSAISGVGGEVVEIGNMRSRYYRFVYTHSSGTGALTVTVQIKGAA